MTSATPEGDRRHPPANAPIGRPAEPQPAGAPKAPQGSAQPEGEQGGPKGPEPTRFGDWEKAGRCFDF
ncbi:DUF1674 domain-containing protein [Geminicoccus roseus]|uniref:DUF1674 domain-containing protein n=1 Tax=Geminicoccus roseus TaxID=404900 RepID=UPI000415ED5E|nr:DUF1674 domain-containing protein [Geminicoccus roseus]